MQLSFQKKKILQCFSLFIGHINFAGYFNYLRAGELRTENSCKPFGGHKDYFMEHASARFLIYEFSEFFDTYQRVNNI